ncbi:MAG: sarcosine oxidase subunit gamma family protein [Pseudomonadota bacterium]
MAKAAKKIAVATRDNPVSGKRAASDGVLVETAPSASRMSLRATPRGVTAMQKSLGITLPREIGTSKTKTGRVAMCLGPDEWLVVDTKNANTSMVPTSRSKEFSATDVSHRNVAFNVSGNHAAECLNAGCPRDLSLATFPKGSSARTVIGKAEVVIHRSANDMFRVECWRSFAPYLFAFLKDAARDADL